MYTKYFSFLIKIIYLLFLRAQHSFLDTAHSGKKRRRSRL